MEWISLDDKKPRHGQVVTSRIAGESGYASGTMYDAPTNTFRTYREYRNRFEVIIWKHNEWSPESPQQRIKRVVDAPEVHR